MRLAARLTGWKIDIKDTAKYDYDAETRKMEAIAEERRIAREEAEQEDDEFDGVVILGEDEALEEDESDVMGEEDLTGSDGFGSELGEAVQRPQR